MSCDPPQVVSGRLNANHNVPPSEWKPHSQGHICRQRKNPVLLCGVFVFLIFLHWRIKSFNIRRQTWMIFEQAVCSLEDQQSSYGPPIRRQGVRHFLV